MINSWVNLSVFLATQSLSYTVLHEYKLFSVKISTLRLQNALLPATSAIIIHSAFQNKLKALTAAFTESACCGFFLLCVSLYALKQQQKKSNKNPLNLANQSLSLLLLLRCVGNLQCFGCYPLKSPSESNSMRHIHSVRCCWGNPVVTSRDATHCAAGVLLVPLR